MLYVLAKKTLGTPQVLSVIELNQIPLFSRSMLSILLGVVLSHNICIALPD